jgi:hypothetical protein
VPRLAEELGRLADPVWFDKFSFQPSSMYLRGYGDALRQAFNAVLRHQSEAAEVLTDSELITETPDAS